MQGRKRNRYRTPLSDMQATFAFILLLTGAGMVLMGATHQHREPTRIAQEPLR